MIHDGLRRKNPEDVILGVRYARDRMHPEGGITVGDIREDSLELPGTRRDKEPDVGVDIVTVEYIIGTQAVNFHVAAHSGIQVLVGMAPWVAGQVFHISA